MNKDNGAVNPNKDSAWLRAAAATVAEPGSGEMILGEMGEKARVVFVGEPFPYDAVWSEDDGWVPLNPKDQAHVGVKPSCRVRMNVWCVERNAMYWYEMSAATFRVLLKHRERAPIEGRVFQIERMDSDDACPIYRIDESGVYLAPPNAVRWDLGSCGHLAERATAEAVRLAGACSVCGHPKNSGPCQRHHP
jgi:hypothetical protein